ncbi:hypothetical protein NQZ68_022204 [Dissostichus eleginoides]|nr:hypothetical protein NQZ68_022204 [Dissostichus eleginoides]
MGVKKPPYQAVEINPHWRSNRDIFSSLLGLQWAVATGNLQFARGRNNSLDVCWKSCLPFIGSRTVA